MVGDIDLRTMLDGLEASFSASVAHEEEAAATDLAVSLSFDRSLRDVLGRSAASAIVDGAYVPVREVGRDHVTARDGLFVALHSGVFRREDGPPPPVTDKPLVEALRRAARGGARVECETTHGSFSGRVVTAGRDYLEIRSAVAGTLVPLASVRWIRLARGGSAGVP
jgi:hypothetical protein